MVLGGCSSNQPLSSTAGKPAVDSVVTGPQSTKSRADRVAASQPQGASTSAPSTAGAASGSSSTTPGAPAVADPKKKGPRPAIFPYKDEVRAVSIVTPSCVKPGDMIELLVKSPPEAGVAYQAVYSDGQSGSEPPFGAGYGGNDGGPASKKGRYESSWIVGPTAPPGRARVDVFVGFEGKWGYASSHFAIADADGNCPADWVKGDE
jgi:hypothetical protein